MIAVIRISGQIGLKKRVAETLERLRLKRKYVCVVLDKPNEAQLGMVKSVRNFVAFGEITEATHKKLIEARGKKDVEGNLKPFFRLHPARGGIKTKVHYPIGVLGENKKMDELIQKML